MERNKGRFVITPLPFKTFNNYESGKKNEKRKKSKREGSK